jgi:hypothetical protein
LIVGGFRVCEFRHRAGVPAGASAWLVARQRGIAATPAAGGFLGVEDCDAIADAAVEAVSELLATWAAETEGAV